MKFESKYDIDQLVEFNTKDAGQTEDTTKIGTIKVAKFGPNPKMPIYDIEVMNTKDTANNIPEENIVKAFRSIS